MVSRKENKMNLLQTLWSWLSSLFRQAPVIALPTTESEGECCDEECEPEEDCCDHEDCEPEEEPTPPAVEQPSATAEQLITELFLSKGVSEKAIEKYEIVKHFTRWYKGDLTADAVRNSIPSFKSGAPAAWVSPKINRAFEE